MKKSLKPILICVGGLLVLGLFITAVVFLIPRDNTSFSLECFQVRSAVVDFLKDVEGERYDEAFGRVFCLSASDGSPVRSTDACRKAWVNRVWALRARDNTYLNGYSDLKVRKQNGTFLVTVTLSVTRQGYNDPFYSDGSVLTVVYDNGWKISSLSHYEESLQTPLEQALSGRFTPAELGEEVA